MEKYQITYVCEECHRVVRSVLRKIDQVSSCLEERYQCNCQKQKDEYSAVPIIVLPQKVLLRYHGWDNYQIDGNDDHPVLVIQVPPEFHLGGACANHSLEDAFMHALFEISPFIDGMTSFNVDRISGVGISPAFSFEEALPKLRNLFERIYELVKLPSGPASFLRDSLCLEPLNY